MDSPFRLPDQTKTLQPQIQSLWSEINPGDTVNTPLITEKPRQHLTRLNSIVNGTADSEIAALPGNILNGLSVFDPSKYYFLVFDNLFCPQ